MPQVHHVLHVGPGGLVGDDQGVTRLDRASGGRCRLRIYRFDLAASDEVAEELVQLLAPFVGCGVQPLQRRILGVLQTVALVFSLDGDDVLRHLGWLRQIELPHGADVSRIASIVPDGDIVANVADGLRYVIRPIRPDFDVRYGERGLCHGEVCPQIDRAIG